MVKVTDDGIATIGTTGQQGEINLKRPQDGLAIGKIQGTNNGLYLTNQDGSNHMLIGNSSTRGVSVGDGSASAMGARFGIKGSGATSATTALLVQNSAGTDLLNIRDDGQIRFNAYYANNSGIFPTGAQNLGVNNVQQWHFGNVYSKGVTHITDNTTSSTTLDASAKLQVDSTTQGFLPPRMTDAERDAIATPAAGLMIYDTTNNQMNYWNGSSWIAF
jgi:hypothetical protein